MHIYTAIRRIRKLIGTKGDGEPLFGGPYEIKRDLPIVGLCVGLALSVALAGFAFGGISGLALGSLGACFVLYAGARTIGKLRRLPEDLTFTDWIGEHVDAALATPSHLSGPNPFHPDTHLDKGSKLLAQTRVVHGNIRDMGGAFWAEYVIAEPRENGLVSDAHHNSVLADHQLLFAPLLRHGLNIGLFKEPVPAAELIEDSFTAADPDPDDIPQHAANVIGTLDEFAAAAKDDPSSWPSRIVHSVSFYVGDSESRAAARRDEVLATLPFNWVLIPATPAQMYWRWYAHCTRGSAWIDTTAATIPAELPQVEFDDGARTDEALVKRIWRIFRNPQLSPVLKITTGDTVSYQSVLTIDFPDVIDWPDTDILSLFAHLSAPIDIAIRCIPKDRELVKQQNDKADTAITDNQQETEHLKNRVAAFSREEQLLQIYSEKLAANPDLQSVLFTVFVAVGGKTPAEVADVVASMNTTFARCNVRFREPRPGKQEELWAAMQPGAPRSPALVRLADETTTDEFAELVPFTTAAIGHRKGPIIARNLTSGLGDVVRLAADEVIQSNRAASIAVIADVGAGKSTLGKVFAHTAHCRSHSWGAIDRSNIEVSKSPSRHTGEWVKFAESLSGTQVVDVTEPPGSCDPLKVWVHDPEEASRRAYGLLTELERMDDNQQLALSEALDALKLDDRAIVSMATLATYLLAQEDPAAVLVGRKIRAWQRRRFAAAIFDDSLPPLSLAAQGTVFRTHGLQLPSAAKVFNEHLYAKLQPEERYAIALYPLLTAFLSAAFAVRGETAWIFIDEAWTVTRSPVGHELLEPSLRDGRKHDLIPVLMSHAGGGDLNAEIYKLITIKFVGRATDEDLALANLQWFGAMPITDHTISEVVAMKDGRFYMAMMNDDGDDRAEGDGGAGVRQVAEIQVLRPADPVIREAMSTKPLRAVRQRKVAAA